MSTDEQDNIIRLTEEGFDSMLEALENPPPISDKLKAAAKKFKAQVLVVALVNLVYKSGNLLAWCKVGRPTRFQHNQITQRVIRVNNEIRISRLNYFDTVWSCLCSKNANACWPGDSKQYFAIYGEYSTLSTDELKNVDVKQFILERLNDAEIKRLENLRK